MVFDKYELYIDLSSTVGSVIVNGVQHRRQVRESLLVESVKEVVVPIEEEVVGKLIKKRVVVSQISSDDSMPSYERDLMLDRRQLSRKFVYFRSHSPTIKLKAGTG